MKSKPITLRFEQEQLDLLMKKEGYKTAGKALNFLLARYYWGHQLNGDVSQPINILPSGNLKTGSGKPIADIINLESMTPTRYKVYAEKLKGAISLDNIVQLDEEIQASDLTTKEKQELHFMAVGFSRKLD